MIYLQDPDVTILHGDALEQLATLPDGSVDCCVTSPPFYGLRDYGVDGQIGLEDTPDEWVAKLVATFREMRRVLKPTGTLWLEVGDSYCSGGSNGHGYTDNSGPKELLLAGQKWGKRPDFLKPKDLLGQPWMLAFALRADGWWLRQCIIWSKPNAMPESVTDRRTTAHSYVFLLAKSARYFFDADAIREPAEWARWGDQTVPKHGGTDTASGWIPERTKREIMGDDDHRYAGLVGQKWLPTGRDTNGRERTDEMRGFDNRLDAADGTKNARSVWTIPTRGYPEAHFATYPEELVRRCILAGCPEDGTVLDPFFGSGTTGLVARKHGRRCIGIELNEDYCKLAARRLQQLSLLAT